MKDLVVLVADKDMELSIEGLLSRPAAMGIRPVAADIFLEPEHDAACALRGVEFLGHLETQYRHALLMLDHEGSGKEDTERIDLQEHLNAEFEQSGWGSRARAIVLEPELEAWIWSDSPHVDEVVGWRDREPKLRAWLVERGWLEKGETKPSRPKEAFEAALRAAQKPHSASLYKRLAESVSVRRCTDAAFGELTDILREWFPVESEQSEPAV